MIMLETRSGGFVPLHNIARIGPRPSWFPKDQRRKDTVTVDLMSGGERVEVEEWALRHLLETPVQTWPALPDTYLLSHCRELDEEGLPPWRTPVIAWGLTLEGIIYPITPEGLGDGSPDTNHPTLMPNGMVIEPGNRSWRSEDLYLADLRAHWADQDAAKAKLANDQAPDDSLPS